MVQKEILLLCLYIWRSTEEALNRKLCDLKWQTDNKDYQ